MEQYESAQPVDDPIDRDAFLTAKIASDTEGIQSHYDLPVEFFASFLGPRMAYSCAYFTHRDNSLAQAEEDKLRMTAQKLELQPGDRVLDIGCGWGSFLFFAVEEYGCRATGITLSNEQVDYVNRTARAKRLDDRVTAELVHVYDMAYPENGFDKVVTIGAIEHIEDLDRTFRKTHQVMTDQGLFMCHGMTKPWSSRQRSMSGEADEVREILRKHFGVGHWKSFWEAARSLERSGFEILDHENITPHYALTCSRWLQNLTDKESEVAGRIIPDDKYREFVALMAGYVSGFEMGATICNQILCQKQKVGRPRPTRPLTRRHMLIDEATPARTAPQIESDTGRWAARSARGRTHPERARGRAAPVSLVHQEAFRARDPELRELFEMRLPQAVESNHSVAEQLNAVIELRLSGDGGCVYSLDLREGSPARVVPGECRQALCSIQMETSEFRRLLREGTVADWLDAFKARRISFRGNLAAAIKLRGIVAQIAGNPEIAQQGEMRDAA